MDLRRDHLKRTRRAPAKLNLYFEVLGRRSDGFHDVESLMVPLRLADSIALTPTLPTGDGLSGEITLDIRTSFPLRVPLESPRVPSGSANLVVKALERLRERSGCSLGARVELVKRIPLAAGLGGGSSDAAAALALANRAWDLRWPINRLVEVAAEIGSDVPFFLFDRPAICRGRGEQVSPLPSLKPLHFVIVKPPAGLSTADVYRMHEASGRDVPSTGSNHLDRIAASLGGEQRPNCRHWMQNRLQEAAASLSPWVERLRAAFDKLDCLAHQLSGSGSAYFGVCRHAQHARRLATMLRSQQLGLVYATRSCP